MAEISYGPQIDKEYCKGCGQCFEKCPMDIFQWDEEKNLPIVKYPGECRFCCACEMICSEAAIDIRLPLHMKIELGIK